MKEQNAVSAESREETRVKRLKRTLFAIIILNIPLYISFFLKKTIEYAHELPESYAENPVFNIVGIWQTAWFMYIFFVPPIAAAVFLVRDIVKGFRAGKKPVWRIPVYILLILAVLAVFFAIYRFMYNEVEMCYGI